MTDSSKAVAGWFNKGDWKQGLKIKPHPSVNQAAFYEQYLANKTIWDKSFEFIRTHNLDSLAPGKYPIDGDNAYASITLAPSRTPDKANWESHNNYIDLQYVIKGKEQIAVAPVSLATVTKPYDAAKDVANYTADGKYYLAEPGTFFLFFPQDAHRPNMLVDGYETVKKIVIKIKVAGK